MDPPDMLDLEGLRSNGPQPGEQMQPQEDEQHQPAGRQLSERWDHHLVQWEMGTTHGAAQSAGRHLKRTSDVSPDSLGNKEMILIM